MVELRDQKFGIEVEFFGLTKLKAQSIVDRIMLMNNFSRQWNIVHDGSINNYGLPNVNSEACELVSPILNFNDIPVLLDIIDALKQEGAQVNNSCGIHIHVGLENHDIKSIKNLVKYFNKYENMFRKSLNVLQERSRYAQPLSIKHKNLVNNIKGIKNFDDLKKHWYYGLSQQSCHRRYSDSRYSSINLHNIWYKGQDKGTIEFRLFNGTLDVEEIFSYIYFVLAISAKAINSKSVNGRKNDKVDDLHLFPKILGGLGITSRNEETKVVYKTLMENMK